MAKITVQWLGHSCFALTADGYRIVVDPYKPGSVPGYEPLSLTANEVFCSHDHGDHGYTAAVRVSPKENSPFTVTCLDGWHDDAQGTKRGPNRMHIFTAHGIRVAHLGDLGCMPTDSQLEQLAGVDALLIPVGGYYTIGPKEAIEVMEKIKPVVTIPMHYRTQQFGYDVIGTLKDFLDLCGYVEYRTEDTISIEKGMAPRVTVLTYQR